MSSFGAGGAFGTNAGGSNAVQTGPELEEIETEALGFLAFSRDAKIRLLPTPWPSDALPKPTSSLLSVASNKGLLAAAGPDALVVASTESVRQAFSADASGDGDVKAFSPQLKINLPMRISQVAFSADENYLIISAEAGGGLAVYDVGSLMQGGTQSTFEMPTGGVSLRAMIPNPTPEKAEYIACVTANGELLMANLKERQFMSGSSGPVLKQGVSCISWSTKGKQLVAGLGDGSAYQMTPEGVGKAEIPRPPGLDGDQLVSSISWLENDLFLMVHTLNSFDADRAPESHFHVVTRQAQNYGYQKIGDPSPPFGMNRSPPHHFTLRLKNYRPSLKDLIIVSSTASTDIGLLTRSETPLSKDVDAEKITNRFTLTTIAPDTRRASLPMSITEDMVDTSAIGLALDLSAKEMAPRPVIGDEMNESPTPLPAIVVLNNEGVLSGWWIVYSEAIRQGIAYPGLVAAGGGAQGIQPEPKASFPISTQQTPAFGQSTFGTPSTPSSSFSAFNKPAASAFSTPSTLGAAGSVGPFGTTSALGTNRGSPWGSSAPNASAQTAGSAFGKPMFGSSTPLGGVGGFGAVAALGTKTSPWATASTGATPASGASFGQPSSLGPSTAGPFGVSSGPQSFGAIATPSVSSTGAPGFVSYANKGGFAVIAAQSSTGSNAFASPSLLGTSSLGGTTNADTSFGARPSSVPAFGTGGFKLGSTFIPDGTAKDDSPKPADTASSLFGSNFGSALVQTENKPSTPVIKEADMDIESASERETTTAPVQTFQSSSSSAFKPATFGATTSPISSKPAATQPVLPESKSIFGQQSLPPAPKSPKIKQEPEDDLPTFSQNIPEAPLPPDPTSKAAYQAGDSSTSSLGSVKPIPDDLPLPPDFIAPKLPPGFIPPKDVPGGPSSDEQPPLPADGNTDNEADGFDNEGSGEDVAQDLSPVTGRNESRGITPQSSFGPHTTFSNESSFDRSPVGGPFSVVPRQQQPKQTNRPLFGEVGKTVPYLPPPSRVQQSPRSPSPVRLGVPGRVLRPDASRSISAPIHHPPRMAQGLTSPPLPTLSKAARKAPVAAPPVNLEEELSDKEDEAIRAELATEVEGTTTLGRFIAHQDYVGDTPKKGIPGQIEKVYRDINSMIDTLGLNARSLKAFTKGHSDSTNRFERTRDDLEQEVDWTLVEIEDLKVIEDEITERLESSRVRDLEATARMCMELEKGLIKIRAKHSEIKKYRDASSNREHIQALRSAPLSATQIFQQNEVRKEVIKFQNLLAEAEEGIMLLKAKLVSTSGKAGGKSNVPTVEAVMNTIMKMTSMAEKKSGDIDVLENQMRKLRMSSVARDDANGYALGTREDSPFRTPPPSTPGKPGSSTYGLFYTPDSVPRGTPQNFRSSFRASTTSPYSPGKGTPRKKLDAITSEDVTKVKQKILRRKQVMKKLKEALAEAHQGTGS